MVEYVKGVCIREECRSQAQQIKFLHATLAETLQKGSVTQQSLHALK